MEYLHEEPLPDVYFTADCLAPDSEGNIISRKGAVIRREDFEKLKSEYYTLRGWDSDGIPTKSKLSELDLSDLRLALEKIIVTK